MSKYADIFNSDKTPYVCNRLEDGMPCGNYPARTADECYGCKGQPDYTADRIKLQMATEFDHQDKRVKAGLKPNWRVLDMLEREVEKAVKE